MKGIAKTLILIIGCSLVISCNNMDPKVKFNPQKDADAFTKVGNKDLKAAERFWDKVEKAYEEKGMEEEYLKFEELIESNDPQMVQEITLNKEIMSEDTTSEGFEIEYDPALDAETYNRLLEKDADQARQFLNEVKAAYNEDGYYDEIQTLESLIK